MNPTPESSYPKQKRRVDMRSMYNKNGYVIYRNLFSSDEIAAVIGDIKYIVYKQGDGLLEILKRSPQKYISILSTCAKTAGLNYLFLQDKTMQVVKRLGIDSPIISSFPVMNVIAHDLQIPGGYVGTEAHQDWPSIQGSLDGITAWACLTETEGNFPLEVIPGSHKTGLLPGQESGSVLAVDVEGREFIPLICHPGDVVFMSGFLVHRTGSGGDELRVAASIRYDNASDPGFIARGYPCAQRRVVDREMITPGFPTPDQVARIFE